MQDSLVPGTAAPARVRAVVAKFQNLTRKAIQVFVANTFLLETASVLNSLLLNMHIEQARTKNGQNLTSRKQKAGRL